MKKHDIFGFTLAEVLITLGIIGIVAAMTLPSLITKHREKETVARFLKICSTLSQALLLTVNEYGSPETWGFYTYSDESESSDPIQRTEVKPLIKQLKVLKDCGYEAKGCFPYEYERLNGGKDRDFENLPRYYKVILEDGSSLAIQGAGSAGVKSCQEGKNCIEVWFDVNGQKGPNVFGRDMFLAYLTKDKITGYDIIRGGDLLPVCGLDGRSDNRGYLCFNWVLKNKNLDYLHCNDLNWETKTKCN